MNKIIKFSCIILCTGLLAGGCEKITKDTGLTGTDSTKKNGTTDSSTGSTGTNGKNGTTGTNGNTGTTGTDGQKQTDPNNPNNPNNSKSGNNAGQNGQDTNSVDAKFEKTKRNQYTMGHEQLSVNKDLIISLNKGPAAFKIFHEGAGKFQVSLFTHDNKLIKNFVDTNGPYADLQSVDITEDAPYILDVKNAAGSWTIAWK
jgi:hypothetical protein